MPFLDLLVQGLNAKFTQDLSCFSPVRAFGISEAMLLAKEDNDGVRTIRYPSMIGNNGEVTMIDVNDDYAITLYHKLESITNSVVTKQAYGDSYGRQSEVANMALVVFAFRDKVLTPVYHLEALLKDGMLENSRITGAQFSVFKAGNSSFDKLALLSREYTEVELNYPSLMAFEIKYRIESTYRKGCYLDKNGC